MADQIEITLPLEENFDAACEATCPTCGLLNASNHYSMTMVGYGSPEGHNHNDNCRTFRFTCTCGTAFRVNPVVRCPACDWVGKRECFCSSKGIPYVPKPWDGVIHSRKVQFQSGDTDEATMQYRVRFKEGKSQIG